MLLGIVRRSAFTALHGLRVFVLSLAAHIPLLVLSIVSVALIPIGIGMLALPQVVTWTRLLTRSQREIARDWAGVDIARAYRPAPGRYTPWSAFRWVVTDPATWREMLWLLVGIPAGVLGLLALAIPFYGLEGTLGVALLIWLITDGYGYGAVWFMDNWGEALLSLPQGAVILTIGVLAGPWLLRAWASVARPFLTPSRSDLLAKRVEVLTESRAETVDAQAAELRRIERDLHDGAQARLVALSMSIGLAEELMASDPGAAQRLLAEARQNSGEALVELRGLVRGIHPPVLAERGFDGAIRALALSVPLPIAVEVDLPGRPQAPVESAAYFAVAEVLANISKHSGATRAWISASHVDGRLLVAVGDNGAGGADPAGGTGLRGIARRLGAFDGTMAVTSPPGGPTVVTMELPCELSSPRTTPSSGTG